MLALALRGVGNVVNQPHPVRIDTLPWYGGRRIAQLQAGHNHTVCRSFTKGAEREVATLDKAVTNSCGSPRCASSPSPLLTHAEIRCHVPIIRQRQKKKKKRELQQTPVLRPRNSVHPDGRDVLGFSRAGRADRGRCRLCLRKVRISVLHGVGSVDMRRVPHPLPARPLPQPHTSSPTLIPPSQEQLRPARPWLPKRRPRVCAYSCA